jgi:hypothetical protein
LVPASSTYSVGSGSDYVMVSAATEVPDNHIPFGMTAASMTAALPSWSVG